MTIKVRSYEGLNDYKLIGDFLTTLYQPGNMDGNWFQPRWEYMHYHPSLDQSTLHRIGIWEEYGKVVAVAHHEHKLGEVFFEVHPIFTHLKLEMLKYAEQHLYAESDSGKRYIKAMINDFDAEFEAIAASKGYKKDESDLEYMCQYEIAYPFPAIYLPDGFRLQSLQDENNLYKSNRLLWRGFNHPGEPPEDGIDDRKLMQSAPNFREDLNIVAVAPNGDFVSYCGMWYDSVNKTAYVEPVATDPDYRRLGLGKAVVLEGIRRCAELGATIAYVGSEQAFYEAIGFKKKFKRYAWIKYLG